MKQNSFEPLVLILDPDSTPLRDNYGKEHKKVSYALTLKRKDISEPEYFFPALLSLVAARYNYVENATFTIQGKKDFLEVAVLGDSDVSVLIEDCKKVYDLPDGENSESNLTFTFSKEKDGYQVSLDYYKDEFTLGFITRLAKAIDCAANHFTGKIKDVSLVDEETISLLDSFNQTQFDCEIKSPLALFEEMVNKFPKKNAVVYQDRHITYEELDEITSNVAHHLIKLGIKKGDYVSLLISRNEYMAITALGVLKSGAAYQPLDPSYPEERLNFMVKDASAKLVIGEKELLPLLSEYKGPSLTVEEIPHLNKVKGKLPTRSLEDHFIILYTSGTTGTPKGCELFDGNVGAFLSWYIPSHDLDENARGISYASFGFDANIMDMYGCLCSGACLYIIPTSMRLDLEEINSYFNKNKITNAFFTTQMARQFALMCNVPSLKRLGGGGEKLVPFNPPKNIIFENCYGPSETTIYVTHYYVKDDYPLLPIGTIVPNMKGYIYDKYLHPLPVGALGELYVSGAQVTKGYLNRPEKTQEVFLPNPQGEGSYSTMYKSGDVVRYMEDGNIEFVGRRDSQVKIRGFRIELTEVEKIIRDYPAVKDATVQAFDSPSGSGKFLAAYLVSDKKLDFEKIKEFILKEKPPYMVPSFFMQIDAIPLNVNGKVDKRKLPEAKHEEAAIKKPTTEMQEKLYDIVKKVLGADDFSIDTDFNSLGLSSITSAALSVEISKQLKKSLKISDIADNPTVEKMETFLSKAVKVKEYKKLKDYPLTKTQMGVFLDTLQHEEDHIYNISILLKLDPSIKIEKLKEALVKVVDCHPILKTRFFYDKNGDIRQSRNDEEVFNTSNIEVIKAKSIDEVKDALTVAFSLVGGRLFAFKIVQAETLYLYLQVHHSISDGSSFDVIFRDLSDAYLGKQVMKETYSAFEVSLDEEEERKSPRYDKAKKYYEELLGAAEPQAILEPNVRDKDKDSLRHIDLVTKRVDLEKVEDFVKKNSLTMNAYFVSAFSYLLAKFNYSEESIFSTIHNGRNDSRSENTVGLLVKSIPVYCKVPLDKEIVPLVMDMKKQLMDNANYDLYSFAEISHDYDIKSDIVFAYQGDAFNFDSLCGKPCSQVPFESKEIMEPLSIQCFKEGNQLRYQLDFRDNLYSEDYVRHLIDVFEKVLNEFFAKTNLKDIDMMSKEDHDFIEKANDNEKDYHCDEETVVSLFAKACQKYPKNIAVTYQDQEYTYQEIDDISSGISRYLTKKGVTREDAVSILISRSAIYPALTLGVLKAGAAYQPLDPTYPVERLNFMVKDGMAKVLIVEKKLRDLVNEYQGEVLFVEDVLALEKENKDVKPIGPLPENKFILLYTSGTTGTPKGVVLEERNLVNFIHFYQDEFKMDEHSVASAYASFGFDANMMDVYPVLTCGGHLVIIPEDMRLDLFALDAYYKKMGVTHSFMTTQMGRQYAEVTTSKDLKFLSVGGEKLVPVMPPKGIHFINGYGPTECTIFSTTYEVKSDAKYLPIGKPLTNYKVYVLDKDLKQVPPYAMGELYICGKGVSRGYLNRPEKTEEVFLKNHLFKKKHYETLYRTGDVVRLNMDGNIEFIGRRDSQVKVRGFRIELTEVESVLREYPDVKDATVNALDNPSGGKMVVAYIVSDKKVDIPSLNKFIMERKPPYMVPAYTIQLDKIPLNANGKVDKRKLPTPTVSEKKEGKEPSTELEKKICAIFEKTLGIEKVYADDDFFAIGGSSISASKVAMASMGEGLSIVYKNLFDHPTPESLAAFISVKEPVEVKKDKEDKEEASEKEEFSSILNNSLISNVDNIKIDKEINDVLLVGATGFLGIHILVELINQAKGTIYCLVRKGKASESAARLKSLLVYYFSDSYEKLFAKKKIVAIDADITNENLDEILKPYHFDTIFNSAAIVKHFSNDDSLTQVNYLGVKRLIDIALKRKCQLIQISTCSIAGENVNDKFAFDFTLDESKFSFGQDLSNKYIHTKYMAEEAILKAIKEKKLRAKIMRMGNLMGRAKDGEFQINSLTNGFMRTLRAYKILGYFPVEAMDTPVEFSPIDLSAQAVVLLSKTSDEFVVFHSYSTHSVHFANIIEVMNEMGFNLKVVDSKTFSEKLSEKMKDEKHNMGVAGLMSYMNNDSEKRAEIPYTNSFTCKALYRLGFSWNLTDKSYLEALLKAVDTLGFFEEDYFLE